MTTFAPTTTTTAMPTPGPCPSWCLLPTDHDLAPDGSVQGGMRAHLGPLAHANGVAVGCGVIEFVDDDGRLEVDPPTIWLGDHELTPAAAAELGAALIAAAAAVTERCPR